MTAMEVWADRDAIVLDFSADDGQEMRIRLSLEAATNIQMVLGQVIKLAKEGYGAVAS